jgi:hypothetical protein
MLEPFSARATARGFGRSRLRAGRRFALRGRRRGFGRAPREHDHFGTATLLLALLLRPLLLLTLLRRTLLLRRALLLRLSRALLRALLFWTLRR